jgi:ribosomal protein S17E
VGIKFLRREAKHTGQDYKTNEETLSELKINPVMKEIRNYINKWIQHVLRMNRDRLPQLIMKY